MPASFNFFTYVTNGSGNVTSQTPTTNAGGSIGTSARYERYYTVSSTANGTATKPFSRESYVFNGTSNVSGFGAISVWDFTLNSANTITRGTGNWSIGNKLTISQGTINFGTGPFGTSTFGDGITLIKAATFGSSSITSIFMIKFYVLFKINKIC
jgi:hypothetical protein